MENEELTLMQIISLFSTEETARNYFEQLRWPDGPVCPHCGSAEHIYRIEAKPAKKIRPGLYECGECDQQFTVTVGTVMEDSKIPIHKWLIAFYMMCASKTQIAALQVQRQLELGSYRTAWFLCHRIRYALKDATPKGKLANTVEIDETYVGGKVHGQGRRYTGNKTPVVALVERGGSVRSQAVQKVTGYVLNRLIHQHVIADAHLNTDESPLYTATGKEFASHDTVNHGAKEYVRHDKETGRTATTNTVEGFFGNTKRSLDGTHHHVSSKHLPFYLAELDHKYNTRKLSDGARTVDGIRKVEGKRLILRRSAQKERDE